MNFEKKTYSARGERKDSGEVEVTSVDGIEPPPPSDLIALVQRTLADLGILAEGAKVDLRVETYPPNSYHGVHQDLQVYPNNGRSAYVAHEKLMGKIRETALAIGETNSHSLRFLYTQNTLVHLFFERAPEPVR